VISDFIMPHMRGDELLCKLHECSPRTVKIMLTGQSDFDGVKRAINGANLYRFMEKPFNNADLVLTVKSAVAAFAANGDLQLQVEQLTKDNAELSRELEVLRKTWTKSLKPSEQSP
jgi:FixJ family two-component response regulator